MDLPQLKSILPLADFILDGLHEEFARTGDEEATLAPGEVSAFLIWLMREGHIDQETYRSAIRRAKVVLPVLPEESVEPVEGGARPVHVQVDSGIRVLGEIDRGGSGEILLAKERDLLRTVALKRLLPEPATDRDAVARFFREVQITAQLEHPNIVPVYRLLVDTPAEDEQRRLSYTMKLIEGKTLNQLIRETRELYDAKEPIDKEHQLSTRLGHMLKVCDAIAYAHSKGILHRDLKPSNVMVGPYGEVYVMDWGVARHMNAPLEEGEVVNPVDLVDEDDDLHVGETRHGLVVGTPTHMSPEQASGDPSMLDGRSDLYSLGLVLFELVTLRRANPGKDSRTAWANAMAGNRRPVEHHARVRIPRELAAIIDKATEEEVDDRYHSVEALAEDLRRYLDGEPVAVAPDSTTQAAARWVSRHREVALWAMLMMLMALLVTVTGSSIALAVYRVRTRAQQEAIADVVTTVADRAHHIDGRFLHYEGLVRGLAAAAVQAMRDGDPAPASVYFAADFDDPERAPPDLAWSDRYRKKLSLDHPVVKLAPGVSAGDHQQRLFQLEPLRYHLRSMMLSEVPDSDDPRGHLLSEGVPVVWSYVGLAEGIHYAYPGKSGYPDDFDPRTRPWYLLAEGGEGPRWGNPYIDKLGQGLILPCAMTLDDDEGQILGVAGVEFTFRYIIDELLELDSLHGVHEFYLLDEEARIVVRSGQRDSGDAAQEALDLPPFPYDAVAQAVREGRSGYAEVATEQGPALAFYTRMDALGWTYAVVADRKAALQRR